MTSTPIFAAQHATLKVRGLSFSYPRNSVFFEWTHDFRAGITWVKGRNGCGKSTLMKLLAGALKPTAGDVEMHGISLANEPLRYRQQIFYCGPGPIAFEHLSPVEFFGFMRTLYASLDEEMLKKNINEFDLHRFLEFPLASLSTGSQRKVWLSIALAAGTKTVLFDEPFNALDAKSTDYFRSVLGLRAQDTSSTYIVTSHEDLGFETASLMLN